MKKICEHCRKYFLLLVCLSCVVFSSVSVAHAAGEVEIISGLLMEMIRAEINPEDANAGEDYAVLMRKFFRTSHAGGTLEVTYDQLQEMCVSLNASGIPCEIVRSNVGYSIRCTGEIVGYDWPINITGCYFSNSDGEVFVAPTSTNKLLILEDIREFVSTIASRLQYTTSDGTTYTAGRLLNIISNRIAEVRDNLATIDTKLTDLSDDVNAMRDYLSMIAGTGNNSWLQQIRDKLTSAITELVTVNTKLDSLSGYVDGVEGTLSNVLHWLTVQAYDGRDIYGTMSNMIYSFYYGDASTRANIQTIWDKYWMPEADALASTLTVRVNADQLREMQRRFNEIGIPTYVAYDSINNRYYLHSAGSVRFVDIDDFGSSATILSTLVNTDRVFTYSGFLCYATESTTSNGVSDLNGKMGTVIQRLDTLIANQGQNLEADVTVDLGDITISSDDTTLTAYIKMLAYGQQDMYSSLAAIAAEYRDASASDKAAMDKILLNYWYTPGSNIGQVYFPGDQLRSIHQHMVEIGYPCLVVWDSSLEAYVIKLTGNPRVSDVFDFSYTGAYSGKQDLYQSGVTYYLTQGGYLLSSRNDGTEASIDSMAANLNTLLNDHQAALLGALDGLGSDLFTYSEGERFLLEGILTQADELVFGQSDMLDRMDTIIEHLSANIGDGGCKHVYVSKIEQEQTCILPGLQTFTCDECGSSYSEILESLGHDWQCTGHVEDELDPESGEVVSSGYDIYTCSRCEDTYHDYEGTGTPEAESNTIAGLIGRVFEKIGSLIGELLAAAVRMLDKLVTGFDDIVTSFNEKTQQIVSFGGTYPAWLAGVWGVVPSDLQLALTFCMVVFCLGVIGKKFAFTS